LYSANSTSDCETFTTPSIIFLDRKTGRPKVTFLNLQQKGGGSS